MTAAGTSAGIDECLHYRGRDGVRLTYRRWTGTPGGAAAPGGEGKPGGAPLVLLHGAASNWTRWWYFVEHSRLAERRVLLRPDLRGHGDSVWRGPARMDHWVEDLDALLHHEGHAKALVIGHCLGANVALHFGARHPARCAGLVLIEPMLRDALNGRLALVRRASGLLDAGSALVVRLNRWGLRRGELARPDLRALDRPVLKARQRGGEAAIERALAAHGSFWQDVRAAPVAQLLANFVELARPVPLEGVVCPTLVVQSSGAGMTDPALTRGLLERLPDVRFRELHSQHWLPAAHPERLCGLIDDWIEERSL